MVWENKEIKNKNLESLRQELSLENIQNASVLTDDTDISNLSTELGEGQLRIVYTGGTLYLYTKYNDQLYRISWGSV